ncbi:hypothetical protein ABZZ44_18600, partial [Streptomyces sp. NPDC006460]|uniref:hypothetical protein n=1 Tax=Streptomyces sp. NPDC006460 TaxID=3154304 RepID=UPI0033AA5FCE
MSDVSETLKAVQDMTDEAPVTDVTETFVQWQELLAELKEKIDARFELRRDPSTEELETFGAGGAGPRRGRGGGTPPPGGGVVNTGVGGPGGGGGEQA